MIKSNSNLPHGIKQNWTEKVCLDTELVANDGSVNVNFAVLQMFNAWLEELWQPDGNVILLPDYSEAELYEFSFKLCQSLEINCHDDSGVCDISRDSDHNNNALDNDLEDIVNEVEEDNNLNSQVDDEIDFALWCGVCLKKFDNKDALRKHKYVHQGEEKCCQLCDHVAPNQKGLNNHMRKHKPKNKKLCPICGTSVLESSIKKHIDRCKIKTTKENVVYSCDHCEFTSKVKYTFERHIIIHKPLPEKFVCNICDAQFNKDSRYQEHLRRKHTVKILPSKQHKCHLCKYESKKRSNFERHIVHVHVLQRKRLHPKLCNKCGKEFKTRKAKWRHQQKCNSLPTQKPLDVEAVIEMLNVNMSFTSIDKLLTVLRKYKVTVTPEVLKKTRHYVKNMQKFFKTERIEMEDKAGKKFNTYVSYCKHLKLFIETLIAGRNIKSPSICIASDGGQNKYVVCMTLVDEDKVEDAKTHLKATGSKRTVILLQCDGVPESEYNIRKLFGLLDLDLYNKFIQFTSDVKVTLKLCGIGSARSYFPCYCCDGAKYSDGQITSGRGLFVKGDTTRTFENLHESYEKFMKEAKGDKKRGPEFKSVTSKPISLQKQFDKKENVVKLPIEVLHVVLLGPPNDLLKRLKKLFPLKMIQFYRRYKIKPHGRGGSFHGPDIRKIMSEKVLLTLVNILDDPSVSDPVVRYLRSIKKTYKLCMARLLDKENYPRILKEFEESFLALYHHPIIAINETPKIHLIRSHLSEYFQLTGKTLRNTSGEYCETLHQALRKSEERHNLRTNEKNYGNNLHCLNISRSTLIYNFKSAGCLVDDKIMPESFESNFDVHGYAAP